VEHRLDEMLDHNTAQDQAPQNGFLFIGELAKLTGTDPKTIRFYERAELISPPRHGRFRTYLASDVRRLKNVLTLRRLGVSIAQIREILAMLAPEEDVLASEKAVNLLRHHLDTLRSRQAEISQQIEKTSSALQSLVA
jgi:MerR family mercuric resistance operon transcriptional regulator